MSQPSANPTYKLSYFNVTALGEPIRILFAYGGIKFEDFRFTSEQWPEIKPTTPFGQVPVLEVDGKKVHQSTAIARYVAKKVGLAGANDWESLLIDEKIDTIHDLRTKIAGAHYEADEAAKAKKFETLKKEVVPFYLDKFDAIAKENNGHFALGKLTWADVVFVGILDYLNKMIGFDLTESHPNLKKLVENVRSVPTIKAWFEKRPKVDF